MKLKRIRWWVRLVLSLAVGASIAGNVLHASGGLISQVIAAWSPTALLLTIELISRVPVHHRGLAVARWLATALIAGIAAYVSYFHMAAVAARQGETGASPYLLPLSVDGLVVVASVCLVELGGRIRAAEDVYIVDSPTDEPGVDPAILAAVAAQTALAAALDSAGELTESGQSAGGTDVPAARRRRGGRKLPPSSAPEVAKILRRNPGATPAQIAAKVGISESTARRHRDAILPPTTSTPEEIIRPTGPEINGNEPELVATPS